MDVLQDNIPAIASGWVIYFHIGALSVLIWDIANNVKSDYEMLVSDFCIKSFLYLLSRIMTLSYAFTKVVYLTIPMEICSILDAVLSAFYVIAVFAILFLAAIHLVLLLDHKRPIVLTMFTLCALVVCGNIAVPIGVSGKNPDPTLSRVCQDSAREYVAIAFILLLAFHLMMLAVILFASRRSTSDDREGLTAQERYAKMAPRRGSLLFLAQPLSSEHYSFYVMTTVLSLAATIWFLVSKKSSGSFRLIPVAVYLVCSSTMLGRLLRSIKRMERQRRVAGALAAPIKLDMPRLDANESVTTRTLVHNENAGTQCDVVGLFQADTESCTPPVVEIEVKQVVQSKHDYSTTELGYHSDDERWDKRSDGRHHAR